jgi:hypothetical protein
MSGQPYSGEDHDRCLYLRRLSTLDGYGSHNGDSGGYWGKQGPELLDRRFAVYGTEQRMVFGASTYRQFARMLGPADAPGAPSPEVDRDDGRRA